MKLTKAQLVERIEELETKTVTYKWEHFVMELQLLVEDLHKSIIYIYEQGARARKAVETIRQPILVEKSNVTALPETTLFPY